MTYIRGELCLRRLDIPTQMCYSINILGWLWTGLKGGETHG